MTVHTCGELLPRNRSPPQAHEKYQSTERENPKKCDYGVDTGATMRSPAEGNECKITNEAHRKHRYTEPPHPRRGSHFLEPGDVSGNHGHCLVLYVCVVTLPEAADDNYLA
jgi:hypothetical protein